MGQLYGGEAPIKPAGQIDDGVRDRFALDEMPPADAGDRVARFELELDQDVRRNVRVQLDPAYPHLRDVAGPGQDLADRLQRDQLLLDLRLCDEVALPLHLDDRVVFRQQLERLPNRRPADVEVLHQLLLAGQRRPALELPVRDLRPDDLFHLLVEWDGALLDVFVHFSYSLFLNKRSQN